MAVDQKYRRAECAPPVEGCQACYQRSSRWQSCRRPTGSPPCSAGGRSALASRPTDVQRLACSYDPVLPLTDEHAPVCRRLVERELAPLGLAGGATQTRLRAVRCLRLALIVSRTGHRRVAQAARLGQLVAQTPVVAVERRRQPFVVLPCLDTQAGAPGLSQYSLARRLGPKLVAAVLIHRPSPSPGLLVCGVAVVVARRTPPVLDISSIHSLLRRPPRVLPRSGRQVVHLRG